MAKLGNNVMIFCDGKVIAGTRSNDAQSEVDLIEKSSPTSGLWRQYVAGRRQWTMNTNYLVMSDDGVRDLLKVGTEYTLSFRAIYTIPEMPDITPLADGQYPGTSFGAGVTGKAILKVCKITATIGNLVQGTFQFVGNGELK